LDWKRLKYGYVASKSQPSYYFIKAFFTHGPSFSCYITSSLVYSYTTHIQSIPDYFHQLYYGVSPEYFGFIYLYIYLLLIRATRWRSWLSYCIRSRKSAGLITEGVTGIFHRHNPSGRIMALGFTQQLTQMSTRNISLG
jgi:hypothetical protein